MALYHTHRPQSFDAVIGQEHIIQTIQNQIMHNKIVHAYLFSGPRGVGKTTTARVLAKAVNCPKRKKGSAVVCNSCDACTSITQGRSIDVIEIDAASHTGVDSVRENIIDNAQFKPTILPFKVFIIDEVHMLSTSAFNALLKTLEEPPTHVLFILATTELHKIPATIVSRCQRFHFKKVPFAAMEKQLTSIAKQEGVSVEKDVLARIINKSDGCVRDAVSLLDQIMATGEKKITALIASLVLPTGNVEQVLALLTALVKKDTPSGLARISEATETGVHMSEFAHDLIELLRALMIHKANAAVTLAGLDISAEAQKELQALGAQITTSELVTLTDLILRRKAEIKTAALPQLPLEMAVIEWCGDDDHKTDNKKQIADNEKQIPKKDVGNKDESAREKTQKADLESQMADNTSKKIKDTKIKDIQSNPSRSQESDPRPGLKGVQLSARAQGSPATTHTLDEIKTVWQTAIQKIGQQSPSLSFILNTATVLAVENDRLIISVPYAFHQEKLSDGDCKKHLETTLSDIADTPLTISFIVNEVSQQAEDDIQELAAAFGGEVIG